MSPLMGRPSLHGTALVGRALLLLLAILLASAPLSLLLAGSSWFALTFTAATPVIVAGIVLRHVLRRLVLVPVLQLAVIALMMLVIEAAQGLVHVSDGPLALLTDQAAIFPGAVSELASGMAPLTLGSRGTVIVVLLIALVTLVLDLIYVDLGWHTPTGLAVMGALLVPALQQPAGGAWWTVAAPLAGGLMILATRTVHADPAYIEGDRRPQAGPLASPGRTVGAAALCVLLVAALAVPAGTLLPSVAPTQVALNMDVINQWQNRDMPQLGPVMIDDDVSVRRSLLEQDDTEVLRYSTTSEDPSYLRISTLNSYDGETYRGTARGEEPVMGMATFSDARGDGAAVTGSDEDLIRSQFSVENLAGDRLPVPEHIRAIDTTQPDVTSALSLKTSNGEVDVEAVRTSLVGLEYAILSEESTATAEQLRAVDPAVFAQPFDAGYTSREEVPQIADDLATEVAREAGSENAFDTAVAYQNFFRDSFAYSLTVNSPPGEDPLESFLSDRIGYCEQFAAAFALMMTSQGYPTRVVIGFTPGEQDGEQWSVSSKNAHAWPEVWFGRQYGWVRFEPTPAAAANGVSTPGVTDPGAADEEQPTEEPSASPTSEAPETTPSEGATTTEDPEDTTEAAASDGGGLVTDAVTVERVESGLFVSLALGFLVAAGGAAAVVLIRRHRVHLRDERWNALVAGGAGGAGGASGGGGGPGGAGEPGDGGGSGRGPDGRGGHGGHGGSGESDVSGGPGAAAAAVAVERERRRAGELAWSELTGELAVRARVIRVLSWTGAWGTPPQHLTLDETLPPARALEDLLDQIADGDTEVTPENRETAGRIASAYTAARYAAPLPEAAEAGPAAEPDAPSAPATGSATPTPEGEEPLRPSARDEASRTAPWSQEGRLDDVTPEGEDPLRPSARDEASRTAPRSQEEQRAAGEHRVMPPLRHDADQIITLIRNSR